MSGKLDQSLDDILKRGKGARRGAGRRVGGGRANGDVKMTDAGGSRVTKSTARGPRGKTQAIAAAIPAPKASGESKIIVSGLPSDIGETQIQEYFSKTVGPVKKVFLTYGPNGQSRGVSTIVFRQAQSAHEAASKLNGVKVDNRAMKIEVVLGANQAPVPAKLGERITATTKNASAKSQPKSAAAVKAPRGRPATSAKRGRNAGRPKRTNKTADELDAEMTDYFVPKAEGGETNGAPVNGAGAAGGDATMDDQIM